MESNWQRKELQFLKFQCINLATIFYSQIALIDIVTFHDDLKLYHQYPFKLLKMNLFGKQYCTDYTSRIYWCYQQFSTQCIDDDNILETSFKKLFLLLVLLSSIEKIHTLLTFPSSQDIVQMGV